MTRDHREWSTDKDCRKYTKRKRTHVLFRTFDLWGSCKVTGNASQAVGNAILQGMYRAGSSLFDNIVPIAIACHTMSPCMNSCGASLGARTKECHKLTGKKIICRPCYNGTVCLYLRRTSGKIFQAHLLHRISSSLKYLSARQEEMAMSEMNAVAGGGLLARCGRAYVTAVQRKGSSGAVAVVEDKEQLLKHTIGKVG